MTAPTVRDLNLVDPTFNSGPNYLNVLYELIRHQYRGKIALQTRLEMVKPEFIDAVIQCWTTPTRSWGFFSLELEWSWNEI